MYFLDQSSPSNFNFLDFPQFAWSFPNPSFDFWNPESVSVKYLHHFVYNILAKRRKWNFREILIQSVQRSLNLLFQRTLFLIFPPFQKYLNPQVRINKLVNSVVYHPCPSILAWGINPYFFKLCSVLSLTRMLVEFSLTFILYHVWENFFNLWSSH